MRRKSVWRAAKRATGPVVAAPQSPPRHHVVVTDIIDTFDFAQGKTFHGVDLSTIVATSATAKQIRR